MKKLYLNLSLLSSFLLTPLLADAIPAKPGLIPMTQPDGSVVNVRIVGDENFHFYLSEDGYLLSNVNDTYYYATVDGTGTTISSGIQATAPAQRTPQAKQYLSTVSMPTVLKAMETRAEKSQKRVPRLRALPCNNSSTVKAPKGPGLFPDSDFPVEGSPKVCVILVNYQDKEMTVENPYEYFDNMMNQKGFSAYGATGSAIDFFTECSNGLFTPDFDIYGPVTLSKNMSYYGGNDIYGKDKNPEKMIIEACQLLDDEVDFAQYDNDGDGYIDNIYVFYAGKGEASGGSKDTVWPHSWNITAATSTPYIFDGVRLDRYACSNENEGSHPDGVGTFVHEFSHVMGLPDLYATSYTSSFTPGAWSCMDYGPYNNDGRTPPLYGAFERYALGWMEPMEISGPLTATLESIGSNKAGIIKTSSANEFFLLENRQQTSWDTYIPGHGMLVWHIQYNASIWRSNKVNNTPSHQYVDIEEADGTQTESSRAGDSFPGTKKVTSFTDDTKPSMKTWAGTALELPITDIAESADGVISFNVCGGAGNTTLEPVKVLEAEDVTDISFVARWESKEDATYKLSVFTRSADSTITYLMENKNVGAVDRYLVEGLQPDMEYIYTVCMTTGWETSVPSAEMTVYTGKAPLNKLQVVALEASDVADNSFTANWTALDDANNYQLTVYTKEPTGFLHEICDFSDGAANLPAGWSASSNTSYAMKSYCGEATPSIRLAKNGDIITTPDVDDVAKRLTFWARGNKTGASDAIKVTVKVNGQWVLVNTYPIKTQEGGSIISVDLSSYKGDAARIEFVKQSDNSSLAIDDIDLAHGMTYEPAVLSSYNKFGTGNVTSQIVAGLEPGKDYYYTVVADNGTLTSRASNEIKVTTTGTAMGIDDALAEGITLTVHTRTVLITGAPAHHTVNIHDLSGRLVATTPAGQSVTIPNAGAYIVSVPQSQYTTKLIIK